MLGHIYSSSQAGQKADTYVDFCDSLRVLVARNTHGLQQQLILLVLLYSPHMTRQSTTKGCTICSVRRGGGVVSVIVHDGMYNEWLKAVVCNISYSGEQSWLSVSILVS